MMAVFFFIAHEKGLKFHAKSQPGTYSRFIRNALYKEQAFKRNKNMRQFGVAQDI